MPYLELHCHSPYSLLDGASPIPELVNQAAALGMPALALTDHDAVYGAVSFQKAAQSVGVRPIFGAEQTTDLGHLTLLVENQAGWANLCWLISQGRANAEKGQALLPLLLLEDHTQGLIALTGCAQGVVAQGLKVGIDEAVRRTERLKAMFGSRQVFIELQHHLLPGDMARNHALAEVGQRTRTPLVATNNVHYATRAGYPLHTVLDCIRTHTTLDQNERLLASNSERYLKPFSKMQPLFPDYLDALARTVEIGERCQFELAFGVQDLPQFPTPEGQSPGLYLRQLCALAVPALYPSGGSQVQSQLAHELRVIDDIGLSNYFLLVWDVVNYARSQGIRCQGRGSAANSLVAYLLGITPVDPLKHALLFERFLSSERPVVPDIDIDFDAARREEVIQYIYDKYGRDQAAMACTFITYRSRSAIRDVGKAMGFPEHLIDKAAKALSHYSPKELATLPELREELGADMDTHLWQRLFDLCAQIRGFPRHLGIHNGGMVVTGVPIDSRIPREPATMPDRTVVQWDKDALEEAGIVKLDILGLRMLSVIAETLQMVGLPQSHFDRLPFDDPNIYQMIANADTVGVFQVESRAQQQVQPRLKPTCFEDLIVSIALIRPGPLQGNMVHPYLRRRAGEEPVSYPHPRLQDTLKETLGVILFQEQVLKVARDIAGITPGQGEVLRRALSGAKDAVELMAELEAGFVESALGNGITEQDARDIFGLLKSFAGYAFAKSHAASFAVMVYQSAWLKYYHPAAFTASLLNNQPMGFWPPSVLVNDAQRHGVSIRPVAVNQSEVRSTADGMTLRLGLSSVKNIGEEGGSRIIEARAAGAFTSLIDFCHRTALPKRLVENLIRVGALDAFEQPRRNLLWELGKLDYPVRALDLQLPPDDIDLPHISREEQLQTDYALMRLSVSDHPLALHRERLSKQGVISSRELAGCAAGKMVKVAGIKVMQQQPQTAKGVRFLTLEDEWDMLNVVIYPAIYEANRQVLRNNLLFVVTGEVQRKDGVINVLLKQVEAIGD